MGSRWRQKARRDKIGCNGSEAALTPASTPAPPPLAKAPEAAAESAVAPRPEAAAADPAVAPAIPTLAAFETAPGHEPAVQATSCIAAMRFQEELAELRRRHPAKTSTEADSQQLEEFEAIQAIYGDTACVISEEGERPLVLRLELPVEAREGGRVMLLIGTADGPVPAGFIADMPHAKLYCALPGSYPLADAAEAMPAIALEAEHLEAHALALLEETLRSKAAKRAEGEPLLFELATTLQEELLVPPEFLLGEDEHGAMDLALRLLAHDRRARDERRQKELQTCPVCFDEVPGSRGVFFVDGCDHFACGTCLSEMARLYVAEANVDSLRCPVTACREPLAPSVVKRLLASDAAALARWEELSLTHCLNQMQDVTFCPRCDADGDGQRVPCIKDEDHMANCGVCGFVFCARCKGVFHPGTECPNQLDSLEARAAGRGPDAEKARMELMTMRFLAQTTKRCPKCGVGIEKTDGCSKVLCQNCKSYFCWRCNKEIKGYDHFASSDCRLFDDDEIRRWNQQMVTVDRAQARAQEARFLANFIDPEELRRQARECPRCRTVVIREGRNNHVRCHACATHFCAKCFEVLQRNKAGDHFNKLRVCPQHSDN